MTSTNPRKRPAPGASGMPMQQIPLPYSSGIDDQALRWNGGANSAAFGGVSSQGVGDYGPTPTPANYMHDLSMPAPSASNMLAVRGMNHALVPTNPRQNFNPGSGAWDDLAGENTPTDDPNRDVSEQEYMEKLERMAKEAKKEALAKKKQIPPFVQKLSSFLDDPSGKYQHLIRWSEKGDSFIVLNEDEFAKKLIPDLFKHNNYASFVRQLNMYGFHKKVGLADNSMRASERKSKSPSEYYNEFFRKGRPNLHWLISKPKSASKSKKGGKNGEGEVESDDDFDADDGARHGTGSTTTGPKPLPPADTGQLPSKKELASIREDLRKVQQNQAHINQKLSGQEERYMDLFHRYKRQEQSIHAIVKFLAFRFRKSLEDPVSAQNVTEMISSLLPGSQMHQSGVFEFPEFVAAQASSPNPMVPNRTRGLLEAPQVAGRAPTGPTSAGSTPTYGPGPQPETGKVTEIFDPSPSDTTSPAHMAQDLDAETQANMLRMMPGAGASGQGLGIAGAAQYMHSPTRGDAHTGHAKPTISQMPVGTSSNIPIPPSVPAPSMPANTMPMSLSPILSSAPSPSAALSPLPPDYEGLHKILSEQDNSIQEISRRISPLSPAWRTPDFDASNVAFGDPNDLGNFDINSFLDFDEFNREDAAALSGIGLHSDGSDPRHFNLDGMADGGFDTATLGGLHNADHLRSPLESEEIARDDKGVENSPSRGKKRRRVA